VGWSEGYRPSILNVKNPPQSPANSIVPTISLKNNNIV
jgi:hypothetical protein